LGTHNLQTGYDSEDLDDPAGEDAMEVVEEEAENTAPSKKRKLTKAAEAKLKAKEKKRGKKHSDDEDYEDDDNYTALSKSLWSNNTPKPPIGSFENCAVCKKQFTVVSPCFIPPTKTHLSVDKIYHGCQCRRRISLSPVRESGR